MSSRAELLERLDALDIQNNAVLSELRDILKVLISEAPQPPKKMSKRHARMAEQHPIRAASPLVREIFTEMLRQGISSADMAEAMGSHQPRISGFRRGATEPGVMTVEEMARHLGFRVVLEPIEPRR